MSYKSPVITSELKKVLMGLCSSRPDVESNFDDLQQIQAIWRRAVSTTESPLALEVGRDEPVGSFGLVEYVAANCSTVRDALEFLSKNIKLVNSLLNVELMEREDCAVLARWTDSCMDHVNTPGAELHFSRVVSLIRKLVDETFKPVGVYFRHQPIASTKYYEEFFGCPILFEQVFDEIHFSSQLLEKRLNNPDQQLASQIQQLLAKELVLLKGQQSEKSYQMLKRMILAGENFTLESLANELKISGRTLRRELMNEGTSYNQILSHVRRDITVRSMILKSFDEIRLLSTKLRFAEYGSFNRLFHTWFDRAPSRHYNYS